jgi:isoleucyl-tRNA synthetase
MILDAMVRLLAPILTFTAEEIWGNLPSYKDKEASVHLAQFPEVRQDRMDKALMEKWDTLIAVKGEISKAIEIARKNKVVGHSLDAMVQIAAPEKLLNLLQANDRNLKTLNIVSGLGFGTGPDGSSYRSEILEGLEIHISKAEGKKCQRCWMYSESVGKDPEHDDICDRCAGNLE